MITLLFLTACPPTEKDTEETTGTTSVDSDSDSQTTSTNQPPGAAIIAITPADPGDADDLTVTVVSPSVDPEGDTVGYTMAWSLDGAAQGDLTGETVTGDRTSPGQTWAVTVTPNDGLSDGPSATAQVVIHGNQPPIPPQIHIDPTAPVGGDALDLIFDVQASDPDGDTLTQTIQWSVDGNHLAVFDGKLTIGGKQVSGGATWTATVFVDDGNNPVVEVSTSVTVANQAPVVDSVSIDPSIPSDYSDLNCLVQARDPDKTPTTTVYRWFRDGVEETSLGNTSTVPAASTTVGEVWMCEATVSDGYLEDVGSATATIVEGTKVIYARTLTATLVPDGNGGFSSATGVTDVTLKTTGAAYGENDCYALWDLVGTTKAKVCRGCDYDFTMTATYNATSSQFNTSTCNGFAADGTGELYYTSSGSYGYGYGNLAITGPKMPIYYYGSSYASYYIEPKVTLGTNYSGSYAGNYRRYAWSSAYDTYGNLIISAENYVRFYQ